MSEYKAINRNFNISDFEEEQDFLTSLHSEGWRLISIKGSKYTFEKCEKGVVSYQIDFNPNEQQKYKYIQLFIDFGWQFITEKSGRFYFSKTTSLCNENESKLFSDRETKAAMCWKIVKHKLFQLIPLSVAIVLVSILIGILLFSFHIAPLFLTTFISGLLLSGLILALYSSYLASFIKLNKIINDDYQAKKYHAKKSKTTMLVIVSLIAIIGGLCLNFENFVFGGYTLLNAIVTACVVLLWSPLFTLGRINCGFMIYTVIYWVLTFVSAIIAWIGVYTDSPLAINLLLFVPTSGSLSGFGFLFSDNLLAIGAIIITAMVAITLNSIFLFRIQRQR